MKVTILPKGPKCFTSIDFDIFFLIMNMVSGAESGSWTPLFPPIKSVQQAKLQHFVTRSTRLGIGATKPEALSIAGVTEGNEALSRSSLLKVTLQSERMSSSNSLQ